MAYSFDIALQNEFSLEENIALARQFLSEQFVSRGMICDFSVHLPDKEDGGIANPHFHVMCPIRPLKENGKWDAKQHRVYVLDENGNRIRDEAGNYVFNAVPTTEWGRPETLEEWRKAWADLCNSVLKKKVCPAASTTAVMSARESSNYPPFMRVPLSGRWRQGASALTRETSTVGSKPPTVRSEVSGKKSLD